jgi:hypothetical protein
MHSRLGPCLLIGFAALVCIPVAVLILFVTLIGIPLAVLTLALYLALLPLAYVMGGIGIGDYVLGRFRTTDAARAGWRVGAAALAVLVLALLARVPILGVVAAFVVLVAGVGALAIQARQPAGS